MAKLLIVDDELKIREVVREYALINGYQVVEACDGLEAIEKVEKGFEFKKYRTPSEIDIRGMRVLDALDKLDKYLDEASLCSLPQVKIIHGSGTGALRQSVREYLNDAPYVSDYRPGEDFEGSDGVTFVTLK